MVDPALAAVTMVALAAALSGVARIWIALRKGAYIRWVREEHLFSLKRVAIDRSRSPFDFWCELLKPFMLALIATFWVVVLAAGLLEGKKFHSRFRNGTAVFDSEGVTCLGDRFGFTHYHSCEGPPVSVSD